MSDERPPMPAEPPAGISVSTEVETAVEPPPPPPPPTSGDDYFNSSRLRVIGLITAGVVAVGVLGGLAGVAFDDEPTDTGKVVQPGTDAGLGSAGNSVALRPPSLSLLGTGFSGADGTSPTPVGSATPEDASPVPGSETPAPTDPAPDEGGEGVTLANGVQVHLPPGWHTDYEDEFQTNFSDGQGNWAYAYSSGTVDTAADAGTTLIAANMEGLLPPDYYTQLKTSEIAAIEPFGSMVSVAYMDYEALWTDGQGAVSLHGQIYAGIRQDGTPLILLVEHAPAEDWDAGFEQVKDIVNNTFVRFSGLG